MTSQALTSPTLQDQEFPDNSILNDSVLWFGDHDISITPRPPNIDEHSQRICNEFDSILCSPSSCFESILPDHLVQDNDSVYESVLRKELETLRRTNEIFDRINDNMDRASENLKEKIRILEQVREKERLEQLARLQQEQSERERLERERIECQKKEAENREMAAGPPGK
ncbi:4464_t:CDS:2, partial [Acaulospora colombiana]